MQNAVKQEVTTSGIISGAEPRQTILFKRIGSTTYRVGVHFSNTSTETMDDKIVRLIRRDAGQ